MLGLGRGGGGIWLFLFLVGGLDCALLLLLLLELWLLIESRGPRMWSDRLLDLDAFQRPAPELEVLASDAGF